MPTLHLICGLPGSGKSTLAAKLERELPALLFTPDTWIQRMNKDGHKKGKRKLVEELQWDAAQKALRLGLDVILENGFWTKQERLQYREQAHAIGAKTMLHFLDVPADELKSRLHNRNKNLPLHGSYVHPDLIDIWLTEFESPTAGVFRKISPSRCTFNV